MNADSIIEQYEVIGLGNLSAVERAIWKILLKRVQFTYLPSIHKYRSVQKKNLCMSEQTKEWQ
jgi:hypothetical protein